MTRAILVITNNETGKDRYYYDDIDTVIEIADNEYAKKYATLSEALKDSEPYRNPHYSDGECLDYVLDTIAQLEEGE